MSAVENSYPISASPSSMEFRFSDSGPKGTFFRIIKYKKSTTKGVYILAFGVENTETGEIDDTIVTNNDNMEKILATVASTVFYFIEHYPDSYVYFQGSDERRTRLYRMGINKYYDEIVKDFDIWGIIKENDLEKYHKTKKYVGFLVKRK